MPRAQRRNRRHPAERYVDDVLAGRVVAGKYVRLACARHVADFKTGRARGFEFDEQRAELPIKFFSLCRHSKGRWGGEVIELAGWQLFVVWSVFGWVHTDTRFRKYRDVLVLVGRKNGKSTFVAALGLYLLALDGEIGAEVYSIATKREQARIIWLAAKRMVDKSPDLARYIKSTQSSLYIPGTASKFQPGSKDFKGAEGESPSAGLIDELHAHRDRELLDVIDLGTGARDQPLMFKISTAGEEGETTLNAEWDYCRSVLDGVFEDDRLFAYLAELDDADDWRDRSTWIKANPNLGVCVSIDDLERKATKAERVPTAERGFRQKHLNQRTARLGAYIDLDLWRENGAPITADELEALRGRKAFGAVDLSQRVDITAATLLFPPEDYRGLPKTAIDPDMSDDDLFAAIEAETAEMIDAGDWFLLTQMWVPADNIEDRVKKDRVPYDRWVDAGHLIATPGAEVDYRYVRKQIATWSSLYSLELLGYDPWRMTETAQRLEEEGATTVELRQGTATYGLPMDKLPALLKARRFRHGGHPVLQWNAANLIARSDVNKNLAPDKKTSREKIDGIVAALMSLRLALVGEDSSSVYDGGKGLETI